MKNVLNDPRRLPLDFKMHFVWSRSLMCKNEILTLAERHPLVVVHRDISNDELYSLHKKVKVVLAPLRYGAGVKGKVNYALLHGVPVIATKVASEGMGLVHEKNFLLAETGDEFIAAINRLYLDFELFKYLAKSGRQIMRELFGRDVAKERLKKAMTDLKIVAKSDHPICPLLNEFDTFKRDWSSYWRTEGLDNQRSATDQQGKFFYPLYPRLPYNNRAFLNYF
jgi:hypothetical protein